MWYRKIIMCPVLIWMVNVNNSCEYVCTVILIQFQICKYCWVKWNPLCFWIKCIYNKHRYFPSFACVVQYIPMSFLSNSSHRNVSYISHFLYRSALCPGLFTNSSLDSLSLNSHNSPVLLNPQYINSRYSSQHFLYLHELINNINLTIYTTEFFHSDKWKNIFLFRRDRLSVCVNCPIFLPTHNIIGYISLELMGFRSPHTNSFSIPIYISFRILQTCGCVCYDLFSVI